VYLKLAIFLEGGWQTVAGLGPELRQRFSRGTERQMTDFTHAGGIVFRYDGDNPCYLVVTAKKNPNHWVLPKGHIDPGETLAEAALREVQEETGVRARVINPIGVSRIQTASSSILILFYLMEYLGEIGKSENRQQRWCSYDEGMGLLSFQNARNLLTKAHEIVTEISILMENLSPPYLSLYGVCME
jgi:8-oxo-dGTP pyrophosphatase MutT (NUDIX family)